METRLKEAERSRCRRVVGKRFSFQKNLVGMDEKRKSGFYPAESNI